MQILFIIMHKKELNDVASDRLLWLLSFRNGTLEGKFTTVTNLDTSSAGGATFEQFFFLNFELHSLINSNVD